MRETGLTNGEKKSGSLGGHFLTSLMFSTLNFSKTSS